MKKIIIIEEEKKKKRLVDNPIFEWLLYMVGYAIVLISVSCLFKKTFYIDSH